MKLGLLIGGETGYTTIRKLINEHEIVFILTDKNSKEIISFGTDRNIPLYYNNPRKDDINLFIKDKVIDVLLSVNYLYIIEQNLISLPKKYAVNIHGSLLPKYRGRTPNVWAIINGEKKTGVTAHLISSECDAGDIIEQKIINISNVDTGYELLKKILSEYPSIISSVLERIENGNIIFKKQNHLKATYFCKRTPNDGIINWSWQKERIYNWVRAIARPYPGAFTFLKEQKIIINKIKYSDKGFDSKLENGTVIDCCKNSFFIKTPNGIIEVINYEISDGVKIENGMILKYSKDEF